MDSEGLGGPVTLVIKAPNQKYEDQTIHCSLDWTVGRLKDHIALVYPSRPVSLCWYCSAGGMFLRDSVWSGTNRLRIYDLQ